MYPTRRYRSSAAALIAACLACAPTTADGMPADLDIAMDAFYEAVESGDDEARIAMFTDDALMLPNHWTMLQGREVIAETIRSGAGYVFRIRNREVVDIDASGNLAYTVNAYSYTYHPVGAEPVWHPTKNVHIWKRDTSGAWKLHVDIWNSDLPEEAVPE